MKPVTFITGNLNKVKHLEVQLDQQITHVKLDLSEIQSLDINEIVEHKVRQAYELVQEPVLVEDGSLEFCALGRLPGPFIRFFNEELTPETMCRMLDSLSRRAIARATFGYFDGTEVRLFHGKLEGEIGDHPRGEHGWHWDTIFIPEGSTLTRAEMSPEEYEMTYLAIRPVAELRAFLESR